ncbi:tungstate-binding protein [Ceratobasidium sp. AG-Ba]|nr:tungstate-binding protein [Ceratobasidium sp. AG-Ba]QRW10835.1 tungstate-binding protein [Ceratobasidium sp. AG-Ba]
MTTTLFTLAIGASALVAALPSQVMLSGVVDTPCVPKAGAIKPADEFCGSNVKCSSSIPTMLRISNGGAGLSGLVGNLSNLFIDSQMKAKNPKRFKIEWIKGDTTESLGYLATGQADVGITYNKAAECQAMHDKVSDRREYGFRDHFYLVGPKANEKNNSFNPAGLMPMPTDGGKPENILQQMQKIVRTGNQGNTPPTRFLSRYDKSATNIKDSELFVSIGQVPWGLAYSKWYHQYTMYPIDALQAAALLQEYTITDRGTWLSTNKSYTDKLTIYNEGGDVNPADPLLNPAFFLTSAQSCDDNKKTANAFLDWVISGEGQKAVANFRKPDSTEWLYTSAPTDPNQLIKNCTVPSI